MKQKKVPKGGGLYHWIRDHGLGSWVSKDEDQYSHFQWVEVEYRWVPNRDESEGNQPLILFY